MAGGRLQGAHRVWFVSLVDTDKAVVSLVHHAEPGLLSPLYLSWPAEFLQHVPNAGLVPPVFDITGSPALHNNFVAIGGCVWVTLSRRTRSWAIADAQGCSSAFLYMSRLKFPTEHCLGFVLARHRLELVKRGNWYALE